eukprot:163459_1
MGEAWSNMTTSSCAGCFPKEGTKVKTAKRQFNLDKEEKKKIAAAGEAAYPRDGPLDSTTGSTDNPIVEEPSSSVIVDGTIDTKTMELLSHLDPIPVSTIPAVASTATDHPILPSDASNPSTKTEPIETRVSITATAIDAIPESVPHTVQSFETNVKSMRVKELSQILDPIELEQLLLKQYESDEEEDEEESESEEMDPAELLEIERRKTESLAQLGTHQRQGSNSLAVVGSQLYRDDSDGRDIDIDALREDMEQQLLALKTGTNADLPDDVDLGKKYQIKVSRAEPTNDNSAMNGTEDTSELDISEDEEKEQQVTVALKGQKSATKHPENSHLFRNQSAYKWDSGDLKHQKEEMQKQMMHLLMDSKSTSK